MEYSVKNQWISCPVCGGNTRTKVREDTCCIINHCFVRNARESIL